MNMLRNKLINDRRICHPAVFDWRSPVFRVSESGDLMGSPVLEYILT
jgi:hypothetical protein